MTSYMVLSRVDEHEHDWTERGIHEANSQRAAKAKAVESMGLTADDSVMLVAIPMRSWEPEIAHQEVRTRLNWGDLA